MTEIELVSFKEYFDMKFSNLEDRFNSLENSVSSIVSFKEILMEENARERAIAVHKDELANVIEPFTTHITQAVQEKASIEQFKKNQDRMLWGIGISFTLVFSTIQLAFMILGK